MNLLCRIFGHNIKIKYGDCFVANTIYGSCIIKAKFEKCTREDYSKMLPHKHEFRKLVY